MTTTLYISDDKRWIVDKLKKTSDNKEGFFESNKDVFVFAVSLGFNHNKQRELLNTKGGEIPLHLFTKDHKDYIDTIAIASTLDITDSEKGKVELLSWEDEDAVNKKLKIFQEYANGGLEILNSELFQTNATIYDNLLQLIYKESSSDNLSTPKIGNLKSLINAID